MGVMGATPMAESSEMREVLDLAACTWAPEGGLGLSGSGFEPGVGGCWGCMGAAEAGGRFIGEIDCVEPGAKTGTGAIGCVDPGAVNAAAGAPGGRVTAPPAGGATTGRRRTVAGEAAAIGAAATASGTGTRAVARGLTEVGVGMPTAGAAGADEAGRRRTVIGRGAPGTTGVAGEAPSGLAKGVTFGGIAPWGTWS
jgi:hypothetical protein